MTVFWFVFEFDQPSLRDSVLSSPTSAPTLRECPHQEQRPAPPPHQGRFSFLFTQMEYGPFCDLWVWRRRTHRRPCCPSLSNPSTFPWSGWPDETMEWLAKPRPAI